MRDTRRHAVVIGGSMTGLLAARVLSGHFERVTLLERDRLPDGPEHRRGVPQARHTHAMLDSGRLALEQLFPGIGERFIERGALLADVSSDTHWLLEGGELAAAPSGLYGVCLSRPAIEAVVRERVRALPNVELRGDSPVAGLAVQGGRVGGVRTGRETIPANLTVDAAGLGSRAPKWLAAMGFETPAEERVEVGIGYTTRHFRRRPGELGGRTAALIPPTPSGKKGGVILAQENDRWIVTLLAHFSEYAPPELPGFIEYARRLPASWIYDVIHDAEPLGEAAETRYKASRRRRYERLRRFPEGFLVIGDGVCSFNPIYGQGMSSCALQAIALDTALAAGDRDLARRFFRKAAKVVDIPWGIAVGNDLRMPEVDAPRTPMTRFVNAYVARLHRAAHHDPALSHAFLRVTNLLAPPESLLRPRIAWRVWRGAGSR